MFFSGIVQYRCTIFLKLMIMIDHIKMMQIRYLDICSMLLSGQVLHRLIQAIKVTCFGISGRPCAKHFPIRKTTYRLLVIGLFHKLISVQDVVHNMLHLHFASTDGITQSSCTSDELYLLPMTKMMLS